MSRQPSVPVLRLFLSAVAVEALKIYHERDLVSHVRAVAPQFLRRLHALEEHPLVSGARGVGRW